MLDHYIQAQHVLQPLTDSANLAKYYDIYDISQEDLIEVETALADRETEDQFSLRGLRTLFGRLYLVRKSILCCLLALGADGGGSDIARWSTAIEQMRNLTTVTGQNMQRMTSVLNEEDRAADVPPSPLPTASPGKERLRAQYRKLNLLSQGIRALHAKNQSEVTSGACSKNGNPAKPASRTAWTGTLLLLVRDHPVDFSRFRPRPV
jgi:hypothetical protein